MGDSPKRKPLHGSCIREAAAEEKLNQHTCILECLRSEDVVEIVINGRLMDFLHSIRALELVGTRGRLNLTEELITRYLFRAFTRAGKKKVAKKF